MSLAALALLVGFVAVAGSVVFAAVRSVALWRALRGFSRALGEELARVGDSVERLSAFEPPDTERLRLAVARMNASRERLSVLTGAVGRVKGQWAGLLAVYPKK